MNTGARRDSRVMIAMGISYLGFVAALLSSTLVARLLGVEAKGEFSLFQVTVFAILAFAGFGAGHGQVFHGLRNPDRMRHFMANSYVIALSTTVTIALLYILTRSWWSFGKRASYDWQITVVMFVAVAVLSVLVFQRQYLLAIESYELAKANMAASQVIPLFAYLLLYLVGRVSLESVIVSFVVSQAICVVVFQYVVNHFEPAPLGFSWAFAKESYSFGILQYLSDLSLFLTSRVDFLLVTWFLGLTGLGIYSVAVSLGEITSRLASELGTMLFPAIASGTVREGGAVAVLRKTIFVSVVIAVLLGLASRPLVLLLFGKAFSAAVPVFRWLLVGTVAWSTIFVTSNHASANGRPALGILFFGAAALFDGILDVLVLRHYGVVGAGIAASGSYWLSAFLFLRVFCKKEGCSYRDALLVKYSDLLGLWSAVLGIRQAVSRGLPKISGVRA